jgi:hypothetical protein
MVIAHEEGASLLATKLPSALEKNPEGPGLTGR